MSADVPDLDLSKGPIEIDIGYLGETEHRDAFIAIFKAVLLANANLLVGVHADPGELYDRSSSLTPGGSDFVELELGPDALLKVGFDNPSFSIDAGSGAHPWWRVRLVEFWQ